MINEVINLIELCFEDFINPEEQTNNGKWNITNKIAEAKGFFKW